MSAESERIDRLEAIVAKALNVDFSEFDTPSQAKERAKALEEAQEMSQKQLDKEQAESGVDAAQDRIDAEKAAGSKARPKKVDVAQIAAGPAHLLTDGTTGGPQQSSTGKPKESKPGPNPAAEASGAASASSASSSKPSGKGK